MVARMTPYVGETLTPRTFREQRRYATARMRADSSMRCLAIEFAVLTAVRPSEAREVRWEEIDLETKIWTIPSNRMKTRLERRVPLSAPVIEILMELKEKHAGAGIFLFPAGMGRSGHIAKYTLLQKAVVTGWEGWRNPARFPFQLPRLVRRTNFPRELAETCLAHSYGDATEERAYRRGDALEKRRQVMEAWAAY
jgi:integrase